VPGTPGPLLVDWPGAEQRGFAGLATHAPGGVSALRRARTLAAAAGATTGIATTGIATTGIELLLTNVLLAPIYPPVLLAKAAASIDQLSGGRLTSGSLPGGEPMTMPCSVRPGPAFEARACAGQREVGTPPLTASIGVVA
jgi:alkanesulfonate monooxygenase SsuD/methylene tetrahydromethanopterin reductase-like flavin-dependent oxidoreductase (luciferase family)